MGSISKIVRVSLVWSALLMTPIAATPRVDCLCPDGQVKLFCLGFSRSTACCSGSCCGQHQASAHGKRATCCGRGRHQPNAPGGSRIAGIPCKKSLVEGKLQVVPPTSAAAQAQATGLALVLAPVPASAAVPESGGYRLSRHRHLLPPPTDLVISLQHLII
jgi:hypothetical protein